MLTILLLKFLSILVDGLTCWRLEWISILVGRNLIGNDALIPDGRKAARSRARLAVGARRRQIAAFSCAPPRG